jgi:predicted N-acyltransferase
MDKIQTEGAPCHSGTADAQDAMVAALSLPWAEQQITTDSPLQTHWHGSFNGIPASAWNALLADVDGAQPFLCHGVLQAFVNSGSACADTGWQPHVLTVIDADGRLLGACPTFAKFHSYGEYVFDWAWADAHDRALASQGQHYYPKLLGAAPFSPIPGQRLLVHPKLSLNAQNAVRQAMLDALKAECIHKGWSSAHLLFLSESEAHQAQRDGWIVRHGVQFHWGNREPRPFADFTDFLASLHRDKRKKIQQERRKVHEAGVHFDIKTGAEISEDDWAFFYRCYAQTYLEHGRQPYLTQTFWLTAARALPQAWVLFIAHQGGKPIASALLAVDRDLGVAYGRYWGALASVSCLHFEACYYQPLSWCIEQGMKRFEGGAQGEHKLARGLLPVTTQSAHWLLHPGLRQAVAEFVQREDQGVREYVNELDERKPFKPCLSIVTEAAKSFS